MCVDRWPQIGEYSLVSEEETFSGECLRGLTSETKAHMLFEISVKHWWQVTMEHILDLFIGYACRYVCPKQNELI